MNRGVPPTAPNARTGELTPPGVTASARANSASEAGVVTGSLSLDAHPGNRALVRLYANRRAIGSAGPGRGAAGLLGEADTRSGAAIDAVVVRPHDRGPAV